MPDTVTADFLILADSAQVQGEKLHMLGGGWSIIWVKQFPAQHQMAVAAAILIPWMETNAKHEFRIRIVAEDSSVFGEVHGQFEQGRPAGMPAGTTQRMMIAANMSIRLERAGEGSAELLIDGEVARAVPFRVVQRPAR
jgi:hypothetical protein